MDAWSADQLKKMQAGGNGALNEFFKQYGVDKYTDIRDKYNNRVAEVSLPACFSGPPAAAEEVHEVTHLLHHSSDNGRLGCAELRPRLLPRLLPIVKAVTVIALVADLVTAPCPAAVGSPSSRSTVRR